MASPHDLFDEMADRLPVGLFTFRICTDGAFAFDYLSPQAARMLGVSAEAVVADAGIAFAKAHPDDLPAIIRGSVEAHATRLPYRMEGRFHTPHGLRRLRIESNAVRDEDGASVWHGVLSDVTELRRAERDLAQAQRIAHVGSFTWHAATDTAELSDEMCRIAGMAPGSPGPTMAGLEPFYTPESWVILATALGKAVATGESYSVDVDMVRPDGTIRHTVAAGEVVLGADGRVESIHGTVADVTEQREFLARLDETQRAEMLGRLAGGIAHDFNNLLAAINGYADFLVGSLLPGDSRREDARAIKQAGLRAATLTRQLLAFGRRLTLQPEHLDIGGVMRELLPMLSGVAGETIDVALHDEALEAGEIVVADRGLVEQAVVNLVLNARDAMPAGGTIGITLDEVVVEAGHPGLRPPAQPGRFLRVAVTDTGSGIDERTLRHVFEPFFTTKEPGHGSGLGLSSVEGSMAQSLGFVTVESAPGQGSTFQLHFPVVAHDAADRPAVVPVAPADADDESDAPGGPGEGDAKPFHRVHVLVAEDEAAVRSIVTRTLRAASYEVTAVALPEDALAAAEGGLHFDVLLTDLMMPGIDGHDLAVRLTRMHPGLPVVYMTGWSSDEVFASGLIPEGTPFLGKPFDRDQLVHAIEIAAGRARAAIPAI